jgi:hypothetical protein
MCSWLYGRIARRGVCVVMGVCFAESCMGVYFAEFWCDAVEWGKCRARCSSPCVLLRVPSSLSAGFVPLSCSLFLVCYVNLPFKEGFRSSPSRGCILCSELFSRWSCWTLCVLGARVSVPPCGASAESSLHVIVISKV